MEAILDNLVKAHLGVFIAALLVLCTMLLVLVFCSVAASLMKEIREWRVQFPRKTDRVPPPSE